MSNLYVCPNCDLLYGKSDKCVICKHDLLQYMPIN